MRGLIREMMRYHAENYATPKLRTRQARALLDFMASSVRQDGSVYSSLLKQELELLRHQADSYLFHEHLEEVNDPIFFHRFAQRAEAHGLQYLGEARISTMLLSSFQPDVEKTLRMLAMDQIQAEQYMDFLRNRTFRETLLCHKTAPVNWGVQPEILRRLHVSSHSVPVKGPVDVQSNDEVTYRTPSGYGLGTTQPLLKATLECLREAWPRPLPFDRLRALARERLGGAVTEQQVAEDQAFLASGLLSGYMGSDLIELHAWPMEFVTTLSDKPVACPYARLQTETGPYATNRRHEMVRLNPFQHALLPLLDGQHDKPAMLDSLVEAALGEKISVQRGDEEIRDPEMIRNTLTPILDQCLEEVRRMAVLVG
jgi:methyltransferase-like protein